MTKSTSNSWQDRLIYYFLIGLLAISFMTFLAVMWWQGAEKSISGLLGLTEKAEILKFLGIGMGGLLVALQALASHRRAKAMEDAATAQSEATNQHAIANWNAEQGQRQERLKNAIEQLGHQSVSVRLGGAYELFHLAQSTEDLRESVHDVLCAHIRGTTTEKTYFEDYKLKPSPEIQSLLTLIFVQAHEVFSGLGANLEGSCLKGANLRGARLRGALLARAQLQFADLRSVRLQGAFLKETRLQFADLRDARLQGSILHIAGLQGAYMQNAGLQGVALQMTGLQAADLRGVQLQGGRVWSEDSMPSSPTFEELITESIDLESDLSGGTFEGGLSQRDIDHFVEGCSDGLLKALLKQKLTPHVGNIQLHGQLPEGCGAVTGRYTKKEAAQWIAEYEEDM